MSNTKFYNISVLLESVTGSFIGSAKGLAKGGMHGTIWGSIVGAIIALATRKSDLGIDDKQKLNARVSQFANSLDPNNPDSKTMVEDFTKQELEKIKNERMFRRVGKGTIYGAGIGAGAGTYIGGIKGANNK